ncbi:hypothetical protein L0156_21455 [bacterium]|nr:hypothetical protein [bacterium]
MAFGAAKSFGELNSSLVTWRLIAFLLGVTQLLTILMLLGARNNEIPVMITKDGKVIEINASMDEWKDEARIPVAKGFGRQMFGLILKQDYRYYENNIAIAQEQMTPSLRTSILRSIKDKNIFRELRANNSICNVEILEDSMEAFKQRDGFDVTLEAIVQTSGSKDIPRRERLTIAAHMKNTPRSTLHPIGLLLDSFTVKQRVAEPYPAANNEQETNKQQEVQILQ